MNVEGVAILERLARCANPASLAVGLQIFAINGFGEDARAGSFAYATRPAEQKRLRQLVIFDGVFERVGDMLLSDNTFESCRAVFACRNNKIIHSY